MNVSIFSKFFLASILLILPTSHVFCQELSGILKKALTAAAEGKCPSTIMSPILVNACEKQMPSMGANLKQRGSIGTLEFKGIQQTPSGPADAYKVNFAGGTNMLWIINVGSDDKINVLWSGG